MPWCWGLGDHHGSFRGMMRGSSLCHRHEHGGLITDDLMGAICTDSDKRIRSSTVCKYNTKDVKVKSMAFSEFEHLCQGERRGWCLSLFALGLFLFFSIKWFIRGLSAVFLCMSLIVVIGDLKELPNVTAMTWAHDERISKSRDRKPNFQVLFSCYNLFFKVLCFFKLLFAWKAKKLINPGIFR